MKTIYSLGVSEKFIKKTIAIFAIMCLFTSGLNGQVLLGRYNLGTNNDGGKISSNPYTLTFSDIILNPNGVAVLTMNPNSLSTKSWPSFNKNVNIEFTVEKNINQNFKVSHIIIDYDNSNGGTTRKFRLWVDGLTIVTQPSSENTLAHNLKSLGELLITDNGDGTIAAHDLLIPIISDYSVQSFKIAVTGAAVMYMAKFEIYGYVNFKLLETFNDQATIAVAKTTGATLGDFTAIDLSKCLYAGWTGSTGNLYAHAVADDRTSNILLGGTASAAAFITTPAVDLSAPYEIQFENRSRISGNDGQLYVYDNDGGLLWEGVNTTTAFTSVTSDGFVGSSTEKITFSTPISDGSEQVIDNIVIYPSTKPALNFALQSTKTLGVVTKNTQHVFNLPLKAFNLTGDVTLSLQSGANFALSGSTTVSQANAETGTDIEITFNAPATVGTYTDVLTISAAGTTDRVITLSAESNLWTGEITNLITTEKLSSDLSLTPASNISISDGGVLTIDETTSVNNIIIEKGGEVTNTSDLTVANIYLLSDADGTGTYVDKGTTHINGTATVQQFLHGGAGTSQRSWWYVSFPVSNATSTVFDVENITPPLNKLWYYNEANDPAPAYTNIATNGTLLHPGTGYVLSLGGNDNIYSFAGSNLNTGDMILTPTRTGTSAVKRGFNLMGNPYPSYLDWNAVEKTNMIPTIWYRTFTAGKQMQFDTFDGEYGTGLGVNGQVNQFIPPMQAFWVKVNTDGSNGSLVLNNNMRYHKDVENNRLKVRALSTAKVLRLKVSNGINGDEALVVTNPNAADGLDGLDSPKMTNDNVAIPEIFTLAGTEEMVINKLKEIGTNKEMALGFRTGEYNYFTLSATQLANFDADTKIILKDNLLNTEQDLTDGSSYSFTSDAETTTTRFSIIFKSAAITTELENKEMKDAVNIFKNANNQIVVNQNAASGQQGKVTICNSVGQKLMITETKGTSTVINKYFPSGIYMVTVNVSGKNITRKVIIN